MSTDAYSEVMHFYGRHMQLLDAGAADEWAATFTEDCSMQLPDVEPMKGRAALAASMREAAGRLRAQGEQRRHWHGMVTVDEAPGGTLAVRCYALVIATPFGGKSRIQRSCVCQDVLERGEDGALRVRSRRVTHDDLNAGLS